VCDIQRNTKLLRLEPRPQIFIFSKNRKSPEKFEEKE
jgi:hypothetical protein